jgi:23S rRNA pseudouridine1911/1915/1917 synthase
MTEVQSAEEFTLTVTTGEGRVDRFIAAQLTQLSRSRVQRLIAEGNVRVNGASVKASADLVAGDVVTVRVPAAAPHGARGAEASPLHILYEDEALLVIDKPAGLVVHSGAGHAGGTLVDALLAQRPAVAQADLDPARPGIVHRLDRDTSGLMLIAVTRAAQAALQAAFKAHEVHKTYLALVQGRLVPERGAIDAPLGRGERERMRMEIKTTGGRAARTDYQVRIYLPGCTFIEASPVTGRTHQLRVHFASIGHAVVGDRVYGSRRPGLTAPRQFLHAWRLTFRHPVTGAELTFTSELPADLAALLKELEREAVQGSRRT